ncbi:hypothetical protein U5A82_02960 [Sphingobium sp. CR2-8]|uniref:hypothetical protein n=1 Tax=Sphingobium sp. CR2-8 TaxID=1306534 RepID=UPI002DBD96CD|nr:hypothetical protein [Sphingobium sp. CR2-8]MEC3909468.1 hypothetical protein [Sphingobium sp. CR2-8]
MTVLDSRLLELIEILVAARLDWLAFELVFVVEAGRHAEESEEALEIARHAIRRGGPVEPRSEPVSLIEQPAPIPTDAQLAWAANYVERRLGDALGQLGASIEALDSLVDGTIEQQDAKIAIGGPGVGRAVSASALLLDGESERECGREDVENAIKSLPKLRAALRQWAGQSPDEVLP